MRIARHVLVVAVVAASFSIAVSEDTAQQTYVLDPTQRPDGSSEDLDFLLHGSMSSEFVPDRVLRALVAANPDLFPGGDLSAFGVIEPGLDEAPIGLTTRTVDYLGGQHSWGINCMSCHSGTVEMPDGPPLVVLGMAGNFNVEAFYGAVLGATFRAGSKDGIGPFLTAYARVYYPKSSPTALEESIAKGREAIDKLLADDPYGAKGIAAGELHEIRPEELEPGTDAPRLAQALLRLFHNMRVALHVPEPPPAPTATPGGPGRNDAFGLLGAALLGKAPAVSAPVKFAHPWNLEGRAWVHWDGNTSDPTVRNVLAALGLGCPSDRQGSRLDMKLISRHTELSERLRSPKYPFAVDEDAAKRGADLYQTHCASCHESADDKRLYTPEEVGTDPNRARLVDQDYVAGFGAWLGGLKIEGFTPKEGSVRPTGKYFAAWLDDAWARAPYLHNGSVRTMRELLTKAADRPKTWRRGARAYDQEAMGFQDGGSFDFDTSLPGNSNSGHEYGADLSDAEKRELIEYLKTR